MKKHFPPPPEVVQRARCYLALRILRAYVDVMGKTHDHRFDDLMDKIRHWLGECEEMLERRPVVATGQTRKSSKSCGSSFPASTAGRRNPRASSTPTGARQSSAPIPCSWTSGPHARPGTGRRFAARMLRATSQTAIRGGIFTRLWNASPKGWRPLSPKLPNWERKST